MGSSKGFSRRKKKEKLLNCKREERKWILLQKGETIQSIAQTEL
jgi:hypothetical protein